MNPGPGRITESAETPGHPRDGANSPLFLAMLAVMVATALFTLNKVNQMLAPAFLAAALLGIMFLIWRHWRAGRKKAAALNYAKLASIDLISYGSWLRENVRGQDEAIDSILSQVQANLALATAGRTLGAFFLVGPTGTGKTFLAQLIADALYPESEPVLLRMNQYKHPDDVFTLIGPPPGRAGYEVGGTLTRPVLENPRRVVIFDELEKAHPDLQHCLYDILDVAACREKSSGRMVDFSGCVFFATCNAGVEALRKIREETGRDAIAWMARSRDALVAATGFDRAFLARWSSLTLMDELSPLHVAEVACLQLARHWKTYGIEIRHAAPEVILDAVQRNDEFKQYGVRQLGAYIQMKTTPAIGQARSRGVTRLNLDVGPNGALEIAPIEGP